MNGDAPVALLRAEAITKSYAGIQALRGVSFELRAGEVHALIGENGAGKSTLIRVITGAVRADSGSVTLKDLRIEENSPSLARSLGIVAVYQQPALFPHLTVAENIGLALEPRGIGRRIRWRDRNVRARELLQKAGSDLSPDRLVSTLSMPEQQIVEIARAIGAEARVVILDEPTASLTDREVDRLFAVIRSLRAKGVGLIYISHRLEEISTIADRVTVLRDGQTIATRDMREVGRSELIHLMVGRDLSAVFPKREVAIGDVVLEARNISSREAGLQDASLTVRAGEILGIAGLVGSGRTELAETLFGLRTADQGEILLRNRPLRLRSAADAIRAGIAYVPEDRRQHGVILQMPITANTSLAALESISHRGLIDFRQECELAQRYIGQLRIKTASLFTEAGALSGGNQQKVALARWMAVKPQVLILDEPTQGVDVGSKSEIHTLMGEMAAAGLAIIMISSELPEVLGMSDRIAVMHAGRIAGTLSRADATPQKILSMALGHPPAGEMEHFA